MKKITRFLALQAAFMGIAATSVAQQAQIQVIHNSPDPSAQSVDIFVDGTEVLSNVDYRQASGFLPVNTTDSIRVGIAVADDNNTSADIIATFPFLLADGESYYVIADGLLGSTFDLFASPGARTVATSASGNTDFAIYHGSLDAPKVDIYVEEAGANVAEDLEYTKFSNFVEVANADYTVQVRDETSSVTVGTYLAPLSTLSLTDQALLVMASGYLSATGNQPTFKLLAVLANGTVAELPSASARAQIIHNSPVAGLVDIWVNNSLAIEDVDYREATGFIDLPAGLQQKVAVTAANATDTVGAPINVSLDVEASKSYYVIASGDGTTGAPLSLQLTTGAREAATSASGNTDFIIHHGSIDAPAVDIYVEEAGANVAEDLEYTRFSNFVEVANADYNVQVRDESSSVTVGTYLAPLSTLNLSDQALLVMASGYLSATGDQPTFKLLAVLANGTVAELPSAAARAQIIHNSSVAGLVDIWVNNSVALEDVDYRQASPFIDLTSGLGQAIAVTAANAVDTVGAPINVSLDIEASKTYIVIASGGSNDKPLELHVADYGREVATNSSNTDVLVYHGSTDAPTVDVWETAVVSGEIVNDLSYSGFDGYLELATNNYILQIRDESGVNSLFDFSAPLSDLNLDSSAIVVIASGYLNPSGNQSSFGLFAATAAGGNLVALPNVTVSTEEVALGSLSVGPNPTTGIVTVNFSEVSQLNFTVNSLDGKNVQNGVVQNGQQIDLSQLPAGVYILSIVGESSVKTVKIFKN